MTAHLVTAGCVVARTVGGGEQYFYAGAFLPEIVSAEEKERLAGAGLVEEIDDRAVGDPSPAGSTLPDDDAILDGIIGEETVEDGDLVEVVEVEPGSTVEDAPARPRRGRR